MDRSLVGSGIRKKDKFAPMRKELGKWFMDIAKYLFVINF